MTHPSGLMQLFQPRFEDCDFGAANPGGAPPDRLDPKPLRGKDLPPPDKPIPDPRSKKDQAKPRGQGTAPQGKASVQR